MMSSGSRICPECGGLNSHDARACDRCGVPFPGPLMGLSAKVWESVLGSEIPITRLYVGLCLLVYAATVLDGSSIELMGGISLSTALRWGALVSGLAMQEPFRLLSAAFIHFGLLHIVFNLMALVDLGRTLERRLGSARYAIVLLATVLSGFMASEFWYFGVLGRTGIPTGGISGGLFGLVGALLGFEYARKDPRWKTMAKRFLLYAVLFAFALPAMSGGSIALNNAAHAGGVVLGAPLGLIFGREHDVWKRRTLMRGIAAVLIASSILSLVLCQGSDYWRGARALEQATGR